MKLHLDLWWCSSWQLGVDQGAIVVGFVAFWHLSWDDPLILDSVQRSMKDASGDIALGRLEMGPKVQSLQAGERPKVFRR